MNGKNNGNRVHQPFRICAEWISRAMGSPVAFAMAVLVIICWAILGPVYGFSDTWQLVINTGTTIVTFLMVFLIQNTQNRDTRAIHLKLDELLRSGKNARTSLIDLERMTDEELDQLQREFEKLRDRAERREKKHAAEAD